MVELIRGTTTQPTTQELDKRVKELEAKVKQLLDVITFTTTAVTIKAPKQLVLEASTSLNLKSGTNMDVMSNAQLKIKSNATAEIKGSIIKLN